MAIVVFDCESDVAFKRLAGLDRRQQFTRMQATCVCVICLNEKMETTRELTLWRDVVADGWKKPFEELLELFDDARVIVGYNALDFDFPLLKKHYTSERRYIFHRLKCHDPLVTIRNATDRWFKMDNLLAWNKLATKTGDGLMAIRLWELGRRDELASYCRRDVQALTELVLLPTLRVDGVGILPNVAFGVSSALKHLESVSENDDNKDEPNEKWQLIDPVDCADCVDVK